MASDQTVSLKLDADNRELKKALDDSAKGFDALAGTGKSAAADIDKALAGIIGSGDAVDSTIRGIDQRLDGLTGADRDVVIKANISAAESGIRQIDQMLQDPRLTDAEIRIALDKRNEATKAIEDLKEQLSELGPAAQEAGDDMERGLDVGALGGAAASAGVAARLDNAATSAGALRAQLGLTGDEAREFDAIAKQVYRDNFGESMGHAAQVTGMVHQSLGLVGDDLRDRTEDIFSISDAFEHLGADAQIITEDVRAMVSNFPGTTEAEALDLIAFGFQNGAGSAGDLQDTLQEYPGDFARLGLEADDMLGILNAGMEAGARNTDIVADAVREMGIRISTAGDTGQRALQEMFPPDEARRLIRDFSAGGQAGRDAVFQVLEALTAIEDPQERYNKAVEIMGTRGEELANQLPAMRDALLAVRDGTLEAAGAAASTQEQYTGFRNTLEGVMRDLETSAIGTLGDTAGGFLDVGANAGIALLGLKSIGDYLPGLSSSLGGILRIVGPLAAALPGLAAAMNLQSNIDTQGNESLSNFMATLPDAQTAEEFASNIDRMIGRYNSLLDTASAGDGPLGALQEGFQNLNPNLPNTISDAESATHAFNEAIRSSLSELDRWRAAEQEVIDQTGLTADEVNELAGILGVDLSAAGAQGEQAISAVVAAHEDGLPGIEGFSGALENEERQIQDTVTAFRDMADAIRGTFDPLFATQDAILAHVDAQEDVWLAHQKVIEAQDEVNRRVRIYGSDSAETAEAVAVLEQAERDFEDAQRRAIRTAANKEAALYDLRAEIENGNTTWDEAVATLDRWVAEGALTEEQARKAKDELGWLVLAAGQLDDKSILVNVDVDSTEYERKIQEILNLNAYLSGRPATRISIGGSGGVPLGIAEGGLVPDYRADGGALFSPRGTDTVPAMLTPGEFVIRAPAVSALGLNAMHVINQADRMMPASPIAAMGSAAGNRSAVVNNYYPAPEPASDSMVRSLRKAQLALS